MSRLTDVWRIEHAPHHERLNRAGNEITCHRSLFSSLTKWLGQTRSNNRVTHCGPATLHRSWRQNETICILFRDRERERRKAKETFVVGDRMSSDRHKRIHHRYGSLSRGRSSKAQIKPREGNALHNRAKVTQIQTLYRHEIVEQVDGEEPRIYSTTTVCSNCKDKGFIWRNVTAHITSSTQKKQTDSKIEQLVNGWKPIGCP